GEPHRRAGVQLARRAEALGPPVGEAERLLVAGRAGLGLVAAEARVVEEEASELDLRLAHRVVLGDVWHREAGRQVPLVLLWGLGAAAEQRERRDYEMCKAEIPMGI